MRLRFNIWKMRVRCIGRPPIEGREFRGKNCPSPLTARGFLRFSSISKLSLCCTARQ